MKFTEMPEDGPKLATYKAKWDKKYRKKWGIKNEFAGRLPNGINEKINNICNILGGLAPVNWNLFIHWGCHLPPSANYDAFQTWKRFSMRCRMVDVR